MEFFSLEKNGILKKQYFNSTCKKSDENTEHLYIKELDGQVLIIDSFNNYIDIYHKPKYEEIQKNLDLLKCFQYRYNKNNSYILNKNETQKINRSTFIICPTYDCNMRCPYCYQQGDSSLDRTQMSEKRLDEILSYIDSKAKIKRSQYKDHTIIIELFGGEPLMKKNYNLIKKIFDHCRNNKYYIAMTTNGLEIDYFQKLLYIYKGYIAGVNTTVDGNEEVHNISRIPKDKSVNSFKKIMSNLNKISDYGFNIGVNINLGKKNIKSLRLLINELKNNNLLNNERFTLGIGRIENRFDNINYNNFYTESELFNNIKYLLKKDYRNKIRFQFLKTLLYPLQKLNMTCNQNEQGRTLGSYCWCVSKIDDVEYIDYNFNIYRCPFSVGKPSFSIGNQNGYNEMLEKMFNHNLKKLEECLTCQIGGYCSGGCFVTKETQKRKIQCTKELENFDNYITNDLFPLLLNMVKNNE